MARRFHPDQVARVVVSLEDIQDLGLATPDTPMEDFLAKELRQEILLALKTRKLKMLFLLMEYGFTPKEISETIGSLKAESLAVYVYEIRQVVRKVRVSGYTSS